MHKIIEKENPKIKPNYKKFSKEICILIRAIGKSNFILKSELENLMTEYNISLGGFD